MLTRGSAVSIAMQAGAPPVFLSSGRSIAPFAFSHVYPHAEWLSHIKPEDCRYTLQLGELSTPLTTFEVAKESVLHHPSIDVVAFSLDSQDEDRFMNFNSFRSTPLLLPAHLADAVALENASVTLNGHDVAADENLRPFVEWKDCTVLACTQTRGLLKIPKPMLEGLSGGGVFGHKPGGDPEEQLLFGILEGNVPPEKESPEIFEDFHCATFVSATGIRAWLSNPDKASSAFE